MTLRRLAWLVAPLALVLTVSACQPRNDPYPDLRSIRSPETTGNPLERRRQIVRDLIEERDLARYKQAIVRHRSGLSDTPPPPAPAATAMGAEEIVRDAPKEPDQAGTLEAESESDRAYRDRAQYDDGTLNDFIRRLKRDTAPVVPEEPLADEDDDLSSSLLPDQPEPQAWRLEAWPGAMVAEARWPSMSTHQPVLLSAFAPAALLHQDGLPSIRLAADAAEPGFFCSYLGWMVAWSTACLVEDGRIENESAGSRDGGGSADVEAERPDARDRSTAGARSTDKPSNADRDNAASQPGADQSQQQEDEVTASEDIDDGASSPVAGALDRLRRLLRSRARPSDESSSRDTALRDPPSLSYEAEALRPPKEEGPPLPTSRPDVALDLEIVQNDRVFEFRRTPLPAFKPIPLEPKTVIFPPDHPRKATSTDFIPAAKPDLGAAKPRTVSEVENKEEQEGAAAPTREEARSAAMDPDEAEPAASTDQAPPSAVIDQPPPEEDPPLDSAVIQFAPGSARLPNGIEGRLNAMLDDARARDARLFIVSEAGVGSLAMERARGVGLALVRLGATADLIEYDIVISKNADRVWLLLKSNEVRRPGEAAADDPDRIR